MTDPTKYNACRDVKGKICRAVFVSGPDSDGNYRYCILEPHSTRDYTWHTSNDWNFDAKGKADGIGLSLLHLSEQDDRTALASIAERNPDWGITLPPEPVDEADLQEARECAALAYKEIGQPNWSEEVRKGNQDEVTSVQSVLTYIKRNREASK